MANRCPDCNKFVSLEIGELEVDTLEVEQEGLVVVDARLPLLCTECGGEMAQANFSWQEYPEGIEEHVAKHVEAGEDEDIEFIVDEADSEAGDFFQTTDRHGKLIKAARYQKHYYTAVLEATVTCSCGETFGIKFEDQIQASAVDELV